MMRESVVYILEVYQGEKTLKTMWNVEDFNSERIVEQLAKRLASTYEKQGHEYAIFKQTTKAIKFNVKPERLKEAVQ